MTILDTNVLSALMRQMPDKDVVAWLDRQARTSVWTTSMTILEVRFGLQILPAGKRRSLLLQAFEAVLDTIGKRVAPFDAAAAVLRPAHSGRAPSGPTCCSHETPAGLGHHNA
jgi:toxin FitB